MPERDGYIPGVPCWVDSSHPDPKAATEFYGPLFGWEFEQVGDGSGPEYFMARIRGLDVGAVGGVPEGAPPIATWNTYIWVDSADDTAAKVKDAGGTVVTEPFDVLEAGRMAVVTDPEGAFFCVWQAKDSKGSQVVNEHGTVNFNNLNTRDVDAAKAFYGAVFGWDVLTLPGGFQAWTLSGYAEHLMKSDPDLKERVAEAGGAEGFENVVAAILPLSDDQPDTPAHWGVTFAVDDADAIGARAQELGATVIVPPMDAPWVRMTVLADPQGAVFTASQYVPENREVAVG